MFLGVQLLLPPGRVPPSKLCPIPWQINVNSQSSSCVLCLLPRSVFAAVSSSISALCIPVGLGVNPRCPPSQALPSTAQSAEAVVPEFYCGKGHALSVWVLCRASPAQRLRGTGLVLSTAAAKVHPVRVVVVVQSLNPLVLMHKGLVVVQLCQGKGSS